ncbi:MAG: DNA polymerase Y family protein [Pseudomonadota bacterium]
MRKPGQSRSLFPTLPFEEGRKPARRPGSIPGPANDPTPPPRHAPERAPGRDRLWLAIECVGLPLLARGGESGDGVPRAIVDEVHGALTVCAANAAARDQGVKAGLPLTAAYALIPELITGERDPAKEARWLERLGAWCLQFTSEVSPVPPNALVLEVRGSLTLFGGLDALVQQLRDALGALGVTHRLAVAPTPLAALWSARSPQPALLDDPARLPDLISRLPLGVTGWPLRIRQRLAGMGLRRVGDVLRLPRDGFARRFGRERRADLDRALGELADPRTPMTLPPAFDATADLAAETERLDLIEHAIGTLLVELGGVLHAHQRGVATFRITLRHLDAPRTTLDVGASQPTREIPRLKRVLHERLETITLAAPVIEVGVHAARMVPLTGRDGDLFSRSVNGAEWPELVETLRARLGVRAVHGLCLVPEHRPEAAWRYVEPGTPGASFEVPERPLWMLSEPVRLHQHGGWPRWEGELRMLRGPERIETGWWDGRDVARDYYVAVNPASLYLWIYRRRRAPHDWYLHGVFA